MNEPLQLTGYASYAGGSIDKMTAQISDLVLHADSEWCLAGVNGEGLFDPHPLGLRVRPASTACWRGYVCTYVIRDDALLLDALDVALEGEPPLLFGRVHPAPQDSWGFTACYKAVLEPIPFTGGLLLARGFLRELYVHMGFHPAWKYEHVLEIDFDGGQVTQVSDCSEAMAQVRARLAGTDQPTTGASKDEIADWIERAFSRKY